MSKNSSPKTVNAAVNENMENRPVRKILNEETARRMVEVCTEQNSSGRNSRNIFKCVEISGMHFKDETLICLEAHYSKFKDVQFETCDLSRMEGYFTEFENCRFVNCKLEDGNFSFAKITNAEFINCNLIDVDMSFAKGNFKGEKCMMRGLTAQNADLKIQLTETNAANMYANMAQIEIEAESSNLRRSEFNDGCVKGSITQTDLSSSEFNNADLSDLKLIDCATRNMETEGAVGIEDPQDDFSNIFNDDDEE